MNNFDDLIKNSSYPFLRLKEINYNKNTDILSVVFRYPDVETLTEEDRRNIISLINSNLSIGCAVNVAIKPVYLDEDEFLKFNKAFFVENFNYNIFIKADKSKIDLTNKNIIIVINKKQYNSTDAKNFEKTYLSKFEEEFCRKFSINYVFFSDEENANIIEKRKQSLDVVERFGVEYSVEAKIKEDIINTMPSNVIFSPIVNVLDKEGDVYICAVVDSIVEREFSKSKKDKEGNAYTTTKKMFSLKLRDETGNIQAVLFPSKENYEKIKMITQGLAVAVFATIDEFGSSKSLKIKSLAEASFELSTEVAFKKLKNKYTNIFPEEYLEMKQASFFFEEENVSNKYLLENDFVVFDLETTGLDADKDRIIEIGAVKLHKGKIIEQFSCFVNPEMHIPEDASNINNITDDMVQDALTIDKVLPDFLLFCKDCILVAYNAEFDTKFIKNNCKKLFYEFKNQVDDCLIWARKIVKGLKNYKLKTVCEAQDVKLVGAHRAVNDTIATAKLFVKLVEQEK